jgi:hypothetical protein
VREITYSQGLTIEDPGLLATLSVFCGKVWLPYDRVGDALQDVLWEARPEVSRALERDPARHRVQEWDTQYKDLFRAGAIERLPGPRHDSHKHRRDFEDHTIEDIIGERRTLYERVALRFHFTRANLPGVELFNTGTPKQEVDLASSLFYLDLPKLSTNVENMLELREEAHKKDIGQFWQMIEEQANYAAAQNQPQLARAEKIRSDFATWNEDRFKLRGTTLGLSLLATLAWYWWTPELGWVAAATGLAVGAGMSVVPQWLGDINAKWATRNMKAREAFKCISCVDRKIRKLSNSS